MSNLDKKNITKKSPYYNKVEINTQHGEYLSNKALYQLGQITENSMKQGLESDKASLSSML